MRPIVYVFGLLYKVVPCLCFPRIVDLSHVQDDTAIAWPINPSYNFSIMHRGPWDPVPWLENNAFQMPEHMGTHIDAPAHFYQGGWRIHQIPIERLCGPGVVINVKDKVAKDRDYRVLVEDILEWEKKYGRLPKGAIVMMNSGWYLKYPNKTLVFGSEKLKDTSTFHFPSWHEDTAQWLVNNRDVSLVGVDVPATDYGQTKTFPVHVLLTKENVLMAENVAHLDKIPESGSTIYIPALKIRDGSGAPARIFATFDNDPQENNANSFVQAFPYFLIIQSFLVSMAFMRI